MQTNRKVGANWPEDILIDKRERLVSMYTHIHVHEFYGKPNLLHERK
jgi:hypothetical protein